MKRTLFMAMIANAIIVSSLTSCKKDDLSPVPGGNTGPVPTDPTAINLVADHWTQNAYGIYTTFGGVISPANSNHHKVKIYLVENGSETQINYPPISFMGGELWATNTETDVKIVFRCIEKNLPFNQLVIKVVIG